MLCITRARTHGHYLKRTLIPLLMGRKRWTRYQNAWKNVPNMMTEKIWRFYVGKYQYARKRARTHVRAFFCETLKMAWNVCKINFKRFGAFLFFARALTRGRTHARAFFDLKLTGRILTLIMINMNEKCLSVKKIWSWVKSTKKNTKWRLDDVMKIWWPWKCYCYVSWQWPITVPKLKEIDWTDLELSCKQKRGEK